MELLRSGGASFPTLMKDYMGVYQFDFIALLEPRISGARANEAIKRIGLNEGARVEDLGFAGGIWGFWKSTCPPILIIATSRYCIHLWVKAHLPTT